MITHKASIMVRKPVADVFKFVCADYFTNHPKTDPRVVSLHLESSGPVAVGTRGQEVRKQGGRKVTYNFEVTEYVTNKLMAMKAKGGPAQFSAVYAVKAVNDKETELEIEFKLKMGGLLMLIEPFMAGSFRKEVAGLCSRIKGMLET